MEKVKEKLAGFAKIMESEHVSIRRRSNPSSQVIYTREKLAKRKKQTSAVFDDAFMSIQLHILSVVNDPDIHAVVCCIASCFG